MQISIGFGPLKWHRDEMIGMPTGVAPICFRSREDLVVTFVTREAPGSLPRRERPDEPLPYRLHALFVNVKSGRLRATREWPTASEKAGVMPATEGNFVMLTPDKLTLYSSELRPIGNLDIFLTHRAHEDWWHVQRSPNGRSILIDYAEDSRYYGFQWVSLDDLRVLRTWREDGSENLWRGPEDLNIRGGRYGSIYEDEMVTWIYKDFFLTRRLDGPWKLVRFSRPVDNLGAFGFLSSQILISVRLSEPGHWKGKITLIRKSGEVLFEEEFPEREWFTYLPSSGDGRRFALAIERGKGGSRPLDIHPHYSLSRLSVFDLPSRRWVYKLEAKTHGIKSISGLALSPDGSLLALINQDGVLELYRLPDTPTVPQSVQ